ncbi:hypothetical protein SmJEL517_g04822 [Synchytrium microbalum]|uniref:Uncharacterized protein n=1 Tax=Synchytrium microbalum TaxID=1806994 RepID=A0A507C381_9FUNG|nr:uncharacterized protein SmJEL517_g04822 [Synchytrium microbalum]TPX32005.1 hypothetical protein SmJEL517_g04822 [Synchytrium microbalum]
MLSTDTPTPVPEPIAIADETAPAHAQTLKEAAAPLVDHLKTKFNEATAAAQKFVEPYYEQYVPPQVKAGLEKALQTTTKFGHDSVTKGRVIVEGATTTITAHTPAPILKVVKDAIEQGKHFAEDPAGTAKHIAEDIKTYVPTYVLNYGSRTYEVIQHTAETLRTNTKETMEGAKKSVEDISARAVSALDNTTGVIVTRVNGVVEKVVAIPQVHNVVEQLKTLIAPLQHELFPGSPSEEDAPIPFLPEQDEAAATPLAEKPKA